MAIAGRNGKDLFVYVRAHTHFTGALAPRDVKALLTTHSPVQGSSGEDWTDSTRIKLVSRFTEPNCTQQQQQRQRQHPRWLPIVVGSRNPIAYSAHWFQHRLSRVGVGE